MKRDDPAGRPSFSCWANLLLVDMSPHVAKSSFWWVLTSLTACVYSFSPDPFVVEMAAAFSPALRQSAVTWSTDFLMSSLEIFSDAVA